MAYSGPPAPPPMQGPPPIGQPGPRPPRPATVTAAAGAMLLVVVLNLIGSVISIANTDTINDAVEKEVGSQSGGAGNNAVTQIIGIGFSLVFSIAFVVLALLILRGSNGGRIGTWVVSGLWLVCGFCGLAASFFLLAVDGIPAWLTAYTIVSSVVNVILYIVIIVLLMLPASNAYFKPPQQGQFY